VGPKLKKEKGVYKKKGKGDILTNVVRLREAGFIG